MQACPQTAIAVNSAWKCGDAAVRRLGHWIKRCRPLYSRLTESGTPFDRRLLTVREVRLIKKYPGQPMQRILSPSPCSGIALHDD